MGATNALVASSSEYSASAFLHLSYPKIEVIGHSPGGKQYNLLNERGEYYRKSSASRSRRFEGRPPAHHSAIERSIQIHKKRIERG